jgi:UDP-N-acetylglucosamine/UDP-N-acetyl-alpha-D-glucosaminouronate 4-epimerase
VAANLAALRCPEPLRGQVFNVGTGQRISLLELVDTLNRIFGTDLEPILQDPRAGDVKDSLASLERIEKVLGYKPVVPFEEGLRRTVEATVGHGPTG